MTKVPSHQKVYPKRRPTTLQPGRYIINAACHSFLQDEGFWQRLTQYPLPCPWETILPIIIHVYTCSIFPTSLVLIVYCSRLASQLALFSLTPPPWELSEFCSVRLSAAYAKPGGWGWLVTCVYVCAVRFCFYVLSWLCLLTHHFHSFRSPPLPHLSGVGADAGLST